MDPFLREDLSRCVLRWVDDGPTLTRCAQVCKMWRDIVAEDESWYMACRVMGWTRPNSGRWRRTFFLNYCRLKNLCPGCLGKRHLDMDEESLFTVIPICSWIKSSGLARLGTGSRTLIGQD
ncbi:hypothetical protein NDN08_006279 [Rhodosorus marinus]|uniref:F-box domain-containing protein n=1 Tax=Rhodosorus marinus TaxID=101924 RepID=A0AAV8UP84_9RHOD|nr:hypothetical protein NDN08_006279 [Rhodosorus marinus]